ncbi:MAG: GNAT family N-acetyltransferase [Proteobacteria bacterium]|nr:GNAT family N-acetyltransferase [Pseudomonadota bacterium]MBU1453356.1 GNAT family N-acetyltransferase [Pseudomonadota bacterium]
MSFFSDKLFTRRLALIKIKESDLPVIVDWSQSETACGAYLSPEKYDMEKMRGQIRSGVFWKDLEKMFLVTLKQDGRPIGTIHYWQPTGGQNRVTMALKVALPEERGKGYGTEIQKFLIMHILERHPVEAIEMYTDINNRSQQRCLQKLGFELIESLIYADQQKERIGHLFRLTTERYSSHPIYQFHYE